MRGAKCLSALFLCVPTFVAALEGEALLNKQKLLNRGFTLSLDDGGNPVYVKIGTPPEVVTVDVTEKLEDIEFAREWLAVVTPFLGIGELKSPPQVGDSKLTPLHVASKHGLVEEARALLEQDVDIDATDQMERTALHHAAIKGHLDVVELLLEWDADVDATDENGSTPVQVVAKMGPGGTRRSVLRRLREAAGLDDEGVSSNRVPRSRGRYLGPRWCRCVAFI